MGKGLSSVVFLRAVNVGGHRTFRPAELAKDLAELAVVNVGAAGTFVVPGDLPEGAVRAAFVGALPFEAELMVWPGRAIQDLASANPFPDGAPDLRRYVSVMSAVPTKQPALPLCHPAGDRWEVQVVGVVGPFAMSLHRRLGTKFVDPNALVEKAFGVAATTRNWNTLQKIREILEKRASR